ncbi:metallophosphoesterase family protein [Leptolyngbya sp. FACHB-541]|uniref:metallophosphoesterase family protein n=1 Tax=Leptolyngbya sp. FACHB-541 TaxID=2692810 RepID=UPI00168749B8|nr:metallophosphoesterase family protein [Leptolyngbya sp. FACHB-541]MBD1999631.1 metallophosphoesterase family protein [Leptolyngbya sp. FACHB-541]
MQVGVISDTHGLLRPEAVAALANSELILHAGDIGNLEVLAELEAIAPVVAVRGNNDTDEWAKAISDRQTLKIEDISVHILHIGREFNLFGTTGVQVVISGHSHKPSIVENNGILFLNPGSAGPRRFKLPISVAHLRVEGKAVHAEIVELAV